MSGWVGVEIRGEGRDERSEGGEERKTVRENMMEEEVK